MPIVYNHIRKDTNKIFYVGIGRSEKRAFDKRGRNDHWNKIRSKAGHLVVITHSDICWEEACAIEKYLIAFYGRLNNKTGILANQTDGGDGAFGAIRSPDTREKLSKIFIGKPLSESTVIQWTDGRRKKENNAFYGKKHSDENRKSWSTLRKGVIPSKEAIEKQRLKVVGRKKPDGFSEKIKASWIIRKQIALQNSINQNSNSNETNNP